MKNKTKLQTNKIKLTIINDKNMIKDNNIK